MKQLQSLPWYEPLDLANGLPDSCWVLLYSGVQTSYSGRYSYLAYDLAEKLCCTDFATLDARLRNDGPAFENAWFGYLGYGLKNGLETLKQDQPNWPFLPNLCMMRFNTILRFDHECKVIELWSEYKNSTIPKPVKFALYPYGVKNIYSNMSKPEYLQKVGEILAKIRDGELYQANLTRKFSGEFDASPDQFALFRQLCCVSPAAFSAFLKIDDIGILSSSPELFLDIRPGGHVRTRPIKGTAPRFSDTVLDLKSKKALEESIKDRAENLMIVDLMRNDLSRTCTLGSVQTERLFEVSSHAAVHHMSSTVTGQKNPRFTTLDTITACFPPGSMTGAPKIQAINVCSSLEKLERGVYSGAIGWLGGDGSCALSVVIRTLVIEGTHFEFQVGGGIVADSLPEGEWLETIDKSKGILKTLNLSLQDIGF